MSCLRSHAPKAEECCHEAAEKCGAATSALDVQEAISWLEEQKTLCQPIDIDVKDAKRRIAAVKGPKKKKVRKNDSDGEEESSAAESS